MSFLAGQWHKFLGDGLRPLPPPLTLAAAATVRTAMNNNGTESAVFVGGAAENSERPSLDSTLRACGMQRGQLAALQWDHPTTLSAPASTPPTPRIGHWAATVGGDRLFVGYGVNDDDEFLSDVYTLDCGELPFTWREVQADGDEMPSRRRAMAAASSGDTVYVYGGWDGTQWLGDLYALMPVIQPSLYKWKRLDVPNGPCARAYHTMVELVPGLLVMYGGHAAGGTLGDTWVLDVRPLEEEPAGEPVWHMVDCAASPPARSAHAACVVGGGTMVMFGGAAGGAETDDVVYALRSNESATEVWWETVSIVQSQSLPVQPPTARAGCALARMTTQVYQSPLATSVVLLGGSAGDRLCGDGAGTHAYRLELSLVEEPAASSSAGDGDTPGSDGKRQRQSGSSSDSPAKRHGA